MTSPWLESDEVFERNHTFEEAKKIVERRHVEPIKFLFLPKMGLLGSQASTEKKLVVNYEQLLRALFSCSHGKNLIKKKN